MKTYLVFKQNGEIEERNTELKILNINDFNLFNSISYYGNFALIYNSNNNYKNITVFSFTKDVFYGDIFLFKVKENNKISNLTIAEYSKKLKCIKCEQTDLYYSSDEELLGF